MKLNMESIRDKERLGSRVEARQSLHILCPVMYAIYSIQCCHISLPPRLGNWLTHLKRISFDYMFESCHEASALDLPAIALRCTRITHYAYAPWARAGNACLRPRYTPAKEAEEIVNQCAADQSQARPESAQDQTRPGWRIRVSDSLGASHCNGAHAFPVSPFKLCYH